MSEPTSPTWIEADTLEEFPAASPSIATDSCTSNIGYGEAPAGQRRGADSPPRPLRAVNVEEDALRVGRA